LKEPRIDMASAEKRLEKYGQC